MILISLSKNRSVYILFLSFYHKIMNILSKSLIRNNGGFYSLYFFLLNHYIYCKKNNLTLYVDTSAWIFHSSLGLSDYFLQNNKIIEYKENNDDKLSPDEDNMLNSKKVKIDQIFESLAFESTFTLMDYKEAIKELYILHPCIEFKINQIQKEYELYPNTYASIFIRRGDKLVHESVLISTEEYFLLLLELEPTVEKIYLQTDDYTVFLELNELCKKYNKEYIQLYTICKENQRGMIVTSIYKNLMLSNTENNTFFTPEYIQSVTPVDKMSPIEKYNHVEEMLIGIELVCQSKICVTDYQSNVSRFIKLRHQSFYHVFDVQKKNIDENHICMPGYHF